MATVATKPNRWWSIIIGTGIALSPVHNQYITNLLTNSNGETLFFLPAFGYLLLIMGAGLFLLNNWQRVKEVGWGDRRIVGCLFFTVLAISASGAAYTGLQDRFAPMLMGISLFGIYLTSRVLGRELYFPLLAGALFSIVGVLIAGIMHPGNLTGGLMFEWNYDIVVGYIVLGVLLYPSRWTWIAVSLALVGLFVSGSPEGVFTTAVLCIAVVWRRDWGWKLAAAVTPLVIIAAIWFSLGWGQQLYSYALDILEGEKTVAYIPAPDEIRESTGIEYIRRDSQDTPIAGELHENPVTDRWNVIRAEMMHMKPLGTGYNLTAFRTNTVHNVPLIIVQQLGWPGILAGLAWLWVSVYCLVKTRWKYSFILIFALSLFDHFVWTQLGVVWWVLIGVSTAPDNIKSDLLFRSPIKK